MGQKLPNKSKTHKPYGGNQQQQSTRTSAGQYSKLYTTPRWRAIRANQLKIKPLCEHCMENGITKRATICDHIEPHRGDMVKFWNGPFQSLCKQCHDSYKQRLEKSGKAIKKIGLDGYPIVDTHSHDTAG